MSSLYRVQAFRRQDESIIAVENASKDQAIAVANHQASKPEVKKVIVERFVRKNWVQLKGWKK
jgi:hypothetical protein